MLFGSEQMVLPKIKKKQENNQLVQWHKHQSKKVSFDCERDFGQLAKEADTIYLAGSFNRWLGTKDGKPLYLSKYTQWRMKANSTDQLQVIFDLEPGTYEYKYVINGKWFPEGEGNNLSISVPTQEGEELNWQALSL